MEIDPIAELALPAPELNFKSKELGREDFLKMLIAQLENQDPLNPQDATEFTAQLAQFSSLEQLVNIDTGIQDLQSSVSLEGLASASVLGREVLLESTRFEQSAGGVVTRPGFELGDAATSVKVKILRGDTLVDTIELEGLSAGVHELDDQMLAEIEPGIYDFEVSAESFNGRLLFARPLVRGIVDAAAPVGGEAQLTLGGITSPYASVREIRFAPQVGE